MDKFCSYFWKRFVDRCSSTERTFFKKLPIQIWLRMYLLHQQLHAVEKNWTLSPQVKLLSVSDVCTNNIVCTNFFSWLYSLIVNYCIPWFNPKFARLNLLKASDVKASTLKKSEMNPSCSITFLQCQKCCCELVPAIVTLESGNIGHLQWMLYLGHKFENC